MSVFAVWLPYGRLPNTEGFVLRVAGLLSWLLPLAVGISLGWRRNIRADAASLFGASAVFATFLFVLSTWSLARWKIVDVFHGPRYPTIMAAMAVVGLAYLAMGGKAINQRRPVARVMSLCPLLICGLYGQVAALQLEHTNETAIGTPGDRGKPVLLFPSRLLPYFRQEFSGLGVAASIDLPCRQVPGPATVIDLNPWKSIDSAPDQMLRWLLEKQASLGKVKRRLVSAGGRNRVVYEIGENDLDLRRYCDQGLVSAGARRLEQVEKVAWGLPEDQVDLRSWSFLEISDGLETRRWGTKLKTRVSLHGAIPAGSRTLHIRGYRPPHPIENIDLVVRLAGGAGEFVVELGPGPFSIRKNLNVDHDIRDPSVVLLHPTWSPSAFGSSEDPRILSFQLAEIWIE